MEGGYGRIQDRRGGGGLNSYTAAGGYGTSKGNHTVIATIRRGIGDYHALGATSSLGIEGGWSWARPNTNWTMTSSLVGERLHALQVGRMEAWAYHGQVTRRLAAHFDAVLDAVYAHQTRVRIVDFMGRGLRLSCVWTPANLRRAR